MNQGSSVRAPNAGSEPGGADVDDSAGSIVPELQRVVSDLLQGRSWPENGILLEFDVDGMRCQVVIVQDATGPSAVPLSPREQEIVRMVARGCTNRMIASVLDISEWTVGTHLRRVFSKLAVNSRAEMIARLFEDGRRRPLSM